VPPSDASTACRWSGFAPSPVRSGEHPRPLDTRRVPPLFLVSVLSLLKLNGSRMSPRFFLVGSHGPSSRGLVLPRARQAKVATFEHLRDMILREPMCFEVDEDHTEWLAPCDTGPCAAQSKLNELGRPPGISPKPCDWEYGCNRWLDEKPSPDRLAGICRMSLQRAQDYLQNMRKIGARRLHRPAPDHYDPADTAVFVMVSGHHHLWEEPGDCLARRAEPPVPLEAQARVIRIGPSRAQAGTRS